MILLDVRHRRSRKARSKPGKAARRAVVHTQRPPECCRTYRLAGPVSDCWDCRNNDYADLRVGLAILAAYSVGGDVLEALIEAEEQLARRSAMTRLGQLAYRTRL